MATCRDVTTEALRALGALAPGDEPQVDEASAALDALQTLMLEWHEARGPMLDVDAQADITPGEDQRIRVQDGDTISVTLPNSVNIYRTSGPYDYGFTPPTALPPVGSTAPVDGRTTRAPRDGARIEIVGTTQALFFYRADTNSWVNVSALTLDAPFPLNERYRGLAFRRLSDAEPTRAQPRLTDRHRQRGDEAALRRGARSGDGGVFLGARHRRHRLPDHNRRRPKRGGKRDLRRAGGLRHPHPGAQAGGRSRRRERPASRDPHSAQGPGRRPGYPGMTAAAI